MKKLIQKLESLRYTKSPIPTWKVVTHPSKIYRKIVRHLRKDGDIKELIDELMYLRTIDPIGFVHIHSYLIRNKIEF